METIKTDRLILRRPQKSDHALLASLLSDEKIKDFVSNLYCGDTADIEIFMHYLYENCDFKNDFCLILEDISNKDIVGIIDAYILSDNIISVSYATKREIRGNGFMPEALQAFLKYLYTNTGIHAVEFSIKITNSPSITIMKKLNIPLYKDLGNFLHYRLSLKEEPSW